MSFIDRLFIATNVELVNMVDNADRALCRFEFYEIIVRIAAAKFHEQGYYESLSQSVESLLENYILRFKTDKMEGQSWRDRELWTIEVDAFLKPNVKNLHKVFVSCSTHAHKKFIMLEDARSLSQKLPKLGLTDEQVVIAFSHSKELHVKEMDDIDKYDRLSFVEFIEFAARCAVLLFADRTELMLTEKIELVIEEMLKLSGEKVRYPPKTEDDELISDYEEDIIQLARKKIKEANHEQFLIVDITKEKKTPAVNINA